MISCWDLREDGKYFKFNLKSILTIKDNDWPSSGHIGILRVSALWDICHNNISGIDEIFVFYWFVNLKLCSTWPDWLALRPTGARLVTRAPLSLSFSLSIISLEILCRLTSLEPAHLTRRPPTTNTTHQPDPASYLLELFCRSNDIIAIILLSRLPSVLL